MTALEESSVPGLPAGGGPQPPVKGLWVGGATPHQKPKHPPYIEPWGWVQVFPKKEAVSGCQNLNARDEIWFEHTDTATDGWGLEAWMASHRRRWSQPASRTAGAVGSAGVRAGCGLQPRMDLPTKLKPMNSHTHSKRTVHTISSHYRKTRTADHTHLPKSLMDPFTTFSKINLVPSAAFTDNHNIIQRLYSLNNKQLLQFG